LDRSAEVGAETESELKQNNANEKWGPTNGAAFRQSKGCKHKSVTVQPDSLASFLFFLLMFFYFFAACN